MELEAISSQKVREIVKEGGVLIYQGCHLKFALVHECYKNIKDGGKSTKLEDLKNIVNISAKDPY